MTQTNRNIFYFTMVLAMAGWGASWVNAKVLSSYINEYELIFLRNFFTIITLAPVLVISRKYFKTNLKSLALSFVTAIVMIVYLKFYFLGTKFGTASLGGALVTTLIPINTFIFMALFFGKRIQRKDIFALILGAIGILTMLNVWTFSPEQIFTKHNTYFLIASILWPIITILSSKAVKTHPLVFSFYMYVFMTVLVLMFFVEPTKMDYASFDWIFWANILCVSIVSTTFATSIYFVGIEKLGTNEVSSFIFLVPVFAITFSVVFLKEHISISIIIGTILTLIAVKILNNIQIFKKKEKLA
jgi:drug/metabolite transporter (DMT)-like permease